MKLNMDRRQFIAAAGAAASAAVLAGCNSNSSSSSSSSTETKTEEKASYTLVEDGKLTVAAELGFAPFEYLSLIHI